MEDSELADLLEEALRRPGVRDLMEVYAHWQAAEAVASMHRQVAAVQRVVFSSDSSARRDRR
jgi:hypothetical protein